MLYFNSEVEPLFCWQSQSYVYAQTHKCTVCKALSAGNQFKRWARPKHDNWLQAMMRETVPQDLSSAALFSHMPTRHTLPLLIQHVRLLCFHNNNWGHHTWLRGVEAFCLLGRTATERRHQWFNDVEEGQWSPAIQRMQHSSTGWDADLSGTLRTLWLKTEALFFRLCLSSLYDPSLCLSI